MLTVTDSVWYSLTAGGSSASNQRAADRRMGQKQKLFSTPAINFYLRGRPTFPEYERAPAGPHRLLMAVNIINALEMIDID